MLGMGRGTVLPPEKNVEINLVIIKIFVFFV